MKQDLLRKALGAGTVSNAQDLPEANAIVENSSTPASVDAHRVTSFRLVPALKTFKGCFNEPAG
ncbi:hypothetical protein [Pseudovibrio sp. Alg231-02]|uniref:hypothetical protein n=1 Tax=Pseudovibrio sp. Alg231-02 TaxID=1922223 RepID=UPI00131EFDDB|nr:hypothetical protein [Pseudovibrio sp. Alg231-02]